MSTENFVLVPLTMSKFWPLSLKKIPIDLHDGHLVKGKLTAQCTIKMFIGGGGGEVVVDGRGVTVKDALSGVVGHGNSGIFPKTS